MADFEKQVYHECFNCKELFEKTTGKIIFENLYLCNKRTCLENEDLIISSIINDSYIEEDSLDDENITREENENDEINSDPYDIVNDLNL